jgi:Cu(I)/Ag(I) efflux system membrane fusion protein
VIPRSAVLDTGTRKIVYLTRTSGVFEAREVQVGAPADDLFPVISGLAMGDKVVLNGNFLIDSQAHLSSGMSGLYGGSKEFSSEGSGQQPSSPAGERAETSIAKVDLHAQPDPLKGGEDSVFQANLIDAAGKPIADARVMVTLVMPAMPAMNMPEMKSSFELPWVAGRQMYVGKGQAPMAGTWNVIVEARRNGTAIASTRTHMSAR